MSDDWPLDNDRLFRSKHFTEGELTKKQQENHWLRNRDAEDGIYTQYPTYDYSYTYYECRTIEELKAAFLYGNWSIRQCFTYKNLAFINQINAGSEWWTLKKFEDGRLLCFDSMSMIRIINHEIRKWTGDFNTSEYEDGSHFRVIRPYVAKEYVEALTKETREANPDHYEKVRYVVGPAKDKKKDVGIYFVDVAPDYFPEYIAQLLKATYEECDKWSYTDDEFDKKWKEIHFGSIRRVDTGKELKEALT